MTYRIAVYPGADEQPILMRHNDGSLVIMHGEPTDEDTRPALIVPRVHLVAHKVAHSISDADQLAFALKVVAMLNTPDTALAAAPDMLEALKAIAAGEGYYGAQAAEYKAIAKAAVAKAGGK